ncbi:hypothetical protein [Rhizobium sp. BK176]|uniref:hypothetical protein n=1 Tax=Rhizobium sp. BK176 TaxID=2587071 RepID=UPI00216A3B58|nr:hypothetical protein [Rhizobium sp. BK176]MCS4088934.1 hypothetical protein [Rhizobium sp. BK176]
MTITYPDAASANLASVRNGISRVAMACVGSLLVVAQAHSHETRDGGDGRVVIAADVTEAKLDRDRRSAQLQVSFGKSLTGEVGRTWSNGLVINCSDGNNTVFANGAGEFSFRLGHVDKPMGPNVTLYTETGAVKPSNLRGLATSTDAFNVWSGVDREELSSILDGLANGEMIYFRIEEPKTGIKSVAISLDNYEGFNNFSAFRSACRKIWSAGS